MTTEELKTEARLAGFQTVDEYLAHIRAFYQALVQIETSSPGGELVYRLDGDEFTFETPSQCVLRSYQPRVEKSQMN